MAAVIDADPFAARGSLPDLRSRPKALIVADAALRAQTRTLAHLWSTINGTRRRQFHRGAMGSVKTTPAHTAHAAIDELVLVFFEALARPMSPAEFIEMEHEVEALIELWDARGLLDDPAALHLDPGPPGVSAIRAGPVGGSRGEWLRFDSGWTAPRGGPRCDRWNANDHNATVPVALLRHRDGPRPWLVLIHGAEMGRPRLDARLLKAKTLHERLGVNIAMPTLPLHGARRLDAPALRGSFPGENVIDNIYGLAQSVFDVRRTIAWIREQEPTAIGVFGFSLGGGVASLLGTLEPDLDALVLGCPAVDLCDLLARNQPPRTAGNARLAQLLSRASLAHRPVSALHLDRRIDRSRLAIIGACADRLSDPIDQVGRLWHHWAQPEIRWIDGGHVTYFARRQSTDALEDMLRSRGVVAGG